MKKSKMKRKWSKKNNDNNQQTQSDQKQSSETQEIVQSEQERVSESQETEQATNIKIVSVPNQDVLILSVEDIMQVLRAIGFSDLQIQEYGFPIRDSMAKSGAVRILIDDVVEADLAVRGDEVFISTRNRGYFIYNIKTAWTNTQR